MNNNILSFFIGSSILSYILWIVSLKRLDLSYYNFDGYIYYMTTPLYFGIMNMLSFYISNKFNIPTIIRFIATSIISSCMVITLVYKFNLYNWKDENKKYKYPLMSLSGHFITYFIIIYILEKIIRNH